MTRKDELLKAFLRNGEFRRNYNIIESQDLKIYQALRSNSTVLVVLAKIIDNYKIDNETALYKQVISLLNEKL